MAQLRRADAAPHSESAVLAVSRGLQISSSLPKTYKDLQKSYKHCSHQSTEVGVLDGSLAQDPPAVPPSGLEPQQPKGGKCTKHWSDEICSRLAWVSTKAMSFANSSTNIDWLMLLKSSEMMRNAKKFTLHCSTHPPSVGTGKRTNHIWNMLKPSNDIAFFTWGFNQPPWQEMVNGKNNPKPDSYSVKSIWTPWNVHSNSLKHHFSGAFSHRITLGHVRPIFVGRISSGSPGPAIVQRSSADGGQGAQHVFADVRLCLAKKHLCLQVWSVDICYIVIDTYRYRYIDIDIDIDVCMSYK